MEDIIDSTFQVNEISNVMLDKTEFSVPEKVCNVVHITRDKVVHADDFMVLPDEKITQMASQKTRAACYQCPFHYRTPWPPLSYPSDLSNKCNLRMV